MLSAKQFIMAQTAMTVRLDSDVKMKFDKLCQEFGMSANTAFNIFVNAVIRSRKIPFTIEASQPLTSQQKAMNAIESMRAKAQATGVAELSLDEINEEIRLARTERKDN